MNTEHKLHEKYYYKLKERETGSISFGNSIIQSKIGIFNYPKGFSRKSIISDLISSPLEGWDDSDFLESKSIEKYYKKGEIVEEKIIKNKKCNCTILLTHPNNIDDWKYNFEGKNIKYIHYNKKTTRDFDTRENCVIVVTPKLLYFLIQHCFHRLAVQRIFLYDPELLPSYAIPQITYGFLWILSSEPVYLLNLPKSNFLYHFLPPNIDSKIFNSLEICKDLKIQDTLKQIHNLPNYNLHKHTCRDEMYKIMHGILDDDIYELLHKGQIKEVLEHLNCISNCNNIWDYIHEKIQNDIDEIKMKLKNYKNITDKKSLELTNLKKNIETLETKKEKLNEKMKEYRTVNECILCLEFMEQPILVYCCQNIICWKCIEKWIKVNNCCPYCRAILHNDDIISLKYPIQQTNSEKKDCTTETKNKINFVKLDTRKNKIFQIIESNLNEIVFFYSEVDEVTQTIISFCTSQSIVYEHFNDIKNQDIQELQKKGLCVILLEDYQDLIGYQFPFVNHFISYSYLKKFIYKFICSRFYRLPRKEDFHFHSFVSFS